MEWDAEAERFRSPSGLIPEPTAKLHMADLLHLGPRNPYALL